ncbi:hypothetical protein SAMN04488074_10375 [Lentzea albidocapillata subsp. violacea]|uniref:Uncharacterized protein n=1 Tax=Lentzea albidocapillata subsp. violacea TaxID=128104 RepID=A0A1G8W579_9PSEU|nr:hypothetical protein [Lentzea albidocapillata]SDJ73429.1 hypothetical protein SAMN04488074_10375 [Lentzea albidocapillata subsp. violacea]
MTRTELENQTPAAARLRTSWALAAAGSLLLTLGPLLGVVDGAEPAFTSWPLLALLALLPPVVAGVLLMRGRPFVAAGLLAAAGVFAVGRLLSDFQIVLDAMDVARPELFRPDTLVAVTPSAGVWLLIAGHVLVIAGGALSAGRAGMPADESEPPTLVAFPVLIAAIAAIGLLGKPFTSIDPFQLDRGPWELPVLGLIGGLLVAVAAPLATALAASSPDPDTRQGGTIGVSLSLLAVVVPPLAVGTLAPGLSISAGSVSVFTAALLLPAVPLLGRTVRLLRGKRDETHDPELPSTRRLHVTAGVFAVLAAVAMLVGALLPQLVLTTGGTAPGLASVNLLWVAGLAFGVLGLLLFVPSAAAVVRPALLGGYLAMQLAAAGMTEVVVAASQVGVAQPGAGFWLMVVEAPLGLLALACTGLAGAIERENAGEVRKEQVPVTELGAVLLAGLFAVGAFVLPTMRGDRYTSPTLIPDSDPAVSWTLLISLTVLIMTLVLVFRSRPARGAATLAGAALLLGVRALELPLTGDRVEGAVAAPGTWLALASIAALLVAAGLMGARSAR